MPTRLKGKGKKREIDCKSISDFLNSNCVFIKFAIIEDVHSMPSQSSQATFTFGKVTGVVIGIIGAYNIPLFSIDPAIWKLSMGLSSDKSLSFSKASQLFPNQVDLWPKKSDEGIVEASLIAYFGKRFY